MDEVKKPLCLALEDARAEIFSVINMAAKRHNIPFYLLESITADAHRQVAALAKQERDLALESYKNDTAKRED